MARSQTRANMSGFCAYVRGVGYVLWGGGNPRTRISWLGSCWDNWPSWGVLWTCALCWRRPLTNKESAITYFTLMANQEAQRHRHLDCAHWMTPLEASDALPVDPLPGVETDGQLLLVPWLLVGLLAHWSTFSAELLMRRLF